MLDGEVTGMFTTDQTHPYPSRIWSVRVLTLLGGEERERNAVKHIFTLGVFAEWRRDRNVPNHIVTLGVCWVEKRERKEVSCRQNTPLKF